MLTWLQENQGDIPGCSCITDLFTRALEGQVIDVTNDSWAAPFLLPTHDSPIAGCVNRKWENWRKLLPHKSWFWGGFLRRGWEDRQLDPHYDYQLPGREHPPRDENGELQKLIVQTEQLGAVALAPNQHRSPASRTFSVPKPDGTERMISDQRWANKNAVPMANKRDLMLEFLNWVTPHEFQLLSDMTKGYWQWRATKRQMLRSTFLDTTGRLLYWTVMTMGGSNTAYWQQTGLSLALKIAQRLWMTNSFVYMDEANIQHERALMCVLQQAALLSLFKFLGIRVNAKTKVSITTSREVFIGIQVFSAPPRAGPSARRLASIRELAASLLQAFKDDNPVTAAQVFSLLGKIRSTLRLHQAAGFGSVRMATCAATFPRNNRGKPLMSWRVPPRTVQWFAKELKFWKLPHPEMEFMLLHCSARLKTLVVDSSEFGYAAEEVTRAWKKWRTSGWFPEDVMINFHHNSHETLGLRMSTEAFIATELHGLPDDTFTAKALESGPYPWHALALGNDNITLVSALNRNTTRSLQIAKILLPLTHSLALTGIQTRAFYIAKEWLDDYYSVDKRGRKKSTLWERALPFTLLQRILHEVGLPPPSSPPLLDLFACPRTAQSPLFVSRHPSSEALWSDALSPLHPWNNDNPAWPNQPVQLYAFPPPKLLPQVIDKWKETHCDGTREEAPSLLLVTLFNDGSILSKLSDYVINIPVIFSVMTSELVCPESSAMAAEYSERTLTLAAVLLSSQPRGSWVERGTEQQRLSTQDGSPQQNQPTDEDGVAGSLTATMKMCRFSLSA